jgi:hypothetical protein
MLVPQPPTTRSFCFNRDRRLSSESIPGQNRANHPWMRGSSRPHFWPILRLMSTTKSPPTLLDLVQATAAYARSRLRKPNPFTSCVLTAPVPSPAPAPTVHPVQPEPNGLEFRSELHGLVDQLPSNMLPDAIYCLKWILELQEGHSEVAAPIR